MIAERIRGPQIGARSRLAYLTQRARDLYEFRYLVRYLAWSALRVERVSFAFGFVWWLLDPFLMICLWTLMIVVIFQRHDPNGYPFPLAIMSAMLAWQFMARTARNSVSLTFAKELQMRQISFPRAVFPLANTLAETVKLSLALLLFPVAALAFGQPLSPVQLLVIPLVLVLMVFTVGISWFLAALNFTFRDTERLIGVLFRLWLFLSPVIYAITFVPHRFRHLYELNPMALILVCFRDVLLYHQVPGLTTAAGAVGMALVTVIFGFVYFHLQEPRFARLN